jgi:hypothetical protein
MNSDTEDATMIDTHSPPRNATLRRRNTSVALAFIFFALSISFAFDFEGNVRILWRDAPLVALTFAIIAVLFAVRWWRTPRS